MVYISPHCVIVGKSTLMRSRLACALAVVALVAVACGQASDTLIVYSGRGENLIAPLLDDFTDATGIQVAVKYAGSAELALLIDEEGDRTPADVFISQSPGAMGFLADGGLLQKINQTQLDLVDAAFRNTDGLWIGLSGRVRVLVYNTTLVDPADLPSSIFDLTDVRYRGQLGLAPANGSFQDFVTAMREIHGDDVAANWLEGMAANEPTPYATNTAIVQAVGRGEVAMGLVNHYYNLRARAEDPSVLSENHHFADGDVGGILIATVMGVLAASDNDEAVARFVEFMLGEGAQAFYSDETFEYPLALGGTPSVALPPLAGYATYDFDSLGGGLERTKELIDASGLENP